MGRDFVVTNSSAASIGIKKRTISKKFSIGPKASRFFAIVIFGALAILYLTQSTEGADRSYTVRDLSDQKTQLLEDRDRLKVEESRLESLNQIDKSVNPEQNQTEAAKMQQGNQLNYLNENSTVAVR